VYKMLEMMASIRFPTCTYYCLEHTTHTISVYSKPLKVPYNKGVYS